MPDHKPLWCVVRLVDYQLAFLELPDCYGPLSLATWFTIDRELAYQTARAQRGLLARWPCVPDASTVDHVQRAIEACNFEPDAAADALA